MILLPGRSSSWSAGGGPSPVTFDGSDYLTQSSDLVGVADSQAVSVYAKFSTTETGTIHVFAVGDRRTDMRVDSNGRVRCHCRNSSNTTICEVVTAPGIVNDGSAHEVFFAYNGSAGTAEFYVDGVDRKNTVTLTTGTAELSNNATVVGASSIFNQFIGNMWRVCLWQDVVLDITSSSVRASMSDETQAASLGDNILDFYGPASVWNAGTNQGSDGSTFTVTGTVVDA